MHEVADHGDRAEARNEMIDLGWQLIERFQGFTFLLFARAPSARTRSYERLPHRMV